MGAKRRLGVSKNRKKAWKKFCDVEDVKNHINESVKDEMFGGAVSTKQNSDLFFVDKVVEKDTSNINTDVNSRNWRNKPLKCHQILQSSSKVAPPIKPTRCKTRKPKVTETKTVETNTNSKGSRKFFDIWDTKEVSITNGLMDEETETYYKRQLKKIGRKPPPLFYKKPSILPSLEVASGGASYNPSFEDHQKLLKEAYDVEISKIKEEEKLKRALDYKFPSDQDAPNQESWLAEMSAGIMVDENVTVESDEEIDSLAPLTLNPPVRPDKRKSARKRRKEKALKVQEKAAELEKMNSKMENEVFRIKSLTNQVMEEKYQQQNNQLKNKLRKFSRAHLPARLSKYKYQNPDLELNLSHELTGSLRTMKNEGSVLHDRFKSFQRRNIIESRIKQKKIKRKYKLKTFTKRGFEDI